MLRVALATVLLSGLAVPFAHGGSKPPGRAAVERQLLLRANGGPDGRVTRAVRCRASGGHRFACVLVGTTGARLGERVRVEGGSLRLVYGSVRG